MAHDELTAQRVRAALAGRHDVVEKKMMGALCFMVTGGMCCSVGGDGGLLVRVADGERDQLLSEPNVRPMQMRGRTMSGFVHVAPEGIHTDASLCRWVEHGLTAVAARAATGRRPRASGGPR